MTRRHFRPIVLALLFWVAGPGIVLSQPLLREGEPARDHGVEANPDVIEPARRKAQLEEERRMKVQAELMRMQGEQMVAERLERERNDRMMRYALWIAIAVIATTFLIAYARSRVAEGSEKPPGDSG